MKNKRFYLILLCAISFSLIAYDILYLENGEEVIGTVNEINDQYIIFNVGDRQKKYPIDDVLNIDLRKQRDGDHWKTEADIDDPLLDSLLKNLPDTEDFYYEDFITLFSQIEYKLSDDSLLYMTTRTVKYVVNESGKSPAGRYEFTYFKDIQDLEIIHARSITAEGKVFHLDDAALEFGSPYGDMLVYDRMVRVKFALGEVNIGSVVDVMITKKFGKIDHNNPVVVTEYFSDFQSRYNQRVFIEVASKNKNLVSLTSEGIEDDEMIDGDYTTYSFKMDYSEPLFEEIFYPSLATLSPYVYAIFSVDLDDRYGETINSLIDNEDAVKSIVDSLKNSEADLLSGIYRYVVDNYTLKGPSYSHFSIYPRQISEILSGGFGNDLDRSFLLYALLKRALYQAELVFIPSYEQPFSHLIDNGHIFHNINPLCFEAPAVLVDDELLFVASDNNQLGALPSDYQRQAVVSFSDNGVVLKPNNSPIGIDSKIKSINITVDEKGSARVFSRVELAGQYATPMRMLKNKTADELKNSVAEYLSAIFHDAILSDYSLENIDDVTKNVIFEYEYTLPHFAQRTDNKLLFRLPEIDYNIDGFANPYRENPFRLDGFSNESTTITIEYPQVFHLLFLPDDISVNTDFLLFRAQFEEDSYKITYSDMTKRTENLFSAERWDEYREYSVQKSNIANYWIVLEK